jgi:hypothetical protein
MKGFTDVYYSRFGSPKWRPSNGLEIDIVPFSNSTKLRNGYVLPNNLETSLSSCDFTTSAIAYSLDKGIIYCCGALEGIDKKEIDILYGDGEEPHILMTRIILHSKKLEFSIGVKANEFIKDRYNPEMDSHIKRYLEYKKMNEHLPLVLDNLKNN